MLINQGLMFEDDEQADHREGPSQMGFFPFNNNSPQTIKTLIMGNTFSSPTNKTNTTSSSSSSSSTALLMPCTLSISDNNNNLNYNPSNNNKLQRDHHHHQSHGFTSADNFVGATTTQLLSLQRPSSTNPW